MIRQNTNQKWGTLGVRSTNWTRVTWLQCCVIDQVLHCWCIPNYQKLNFRRNTLFFLVSDNITSVMPRNRQLRTSLQTSPHIRTHCPMHSRHTLTGSLSSSQRQFTMCVPYLQQHKHWYTVDDTQNCTHVRNVIRIRLIVQEPSNDFNLSDFEKRGFDTPIHSGHYIHCHDRETVKACRYIGTFSTVFNLCVHSVDRETVLGAKSQTITLRIGLIVFFTSSHRTCLIFLLTDSLFSHICRLISLENEKSSNNTTREGKEFVIQNIHRLQLPHFTASQDVSNT